MASPFRIFSDEEILQASKDFKEKGYFIIENFLKEQFAEDMYKFLKYDMKKDLWNWSLYPSDPRYIQAGKNHRQLYKKNYENVLAEYRKKNFSYNFYRTLYHQSNCKCPLCICLILLRSDQIVDFFKKITGYNDLAGDKELFASSYRKGCFLTRHTDKGNGKVAFVYNITKNWHLTFGGNLFLLDPTDESKVSEVFTPKFNRLIMFNVTDNGRPHFVSNVSDAIGDDLERISITGWY